METDRDTGSLHTNPSFHSERTRGAGLRVLVIIQQVFMALFLAGVFTVMPCRSEPVKVPDEIIYKPSPIPDRIILTPVGDPSRMMAVTWRSDTSAPRGYAQIARAEHGPGFVSKALLIPSATTSLSTETGAAIFHSVIFTDLLPETGYVYRVGDGLNWSEWFQFKTASDQSAPFSFIYLGDSQNDIRSLWSRVIRLAFSKAPEARFLLHAGDLVNNWWRDVEWGQWFSAGAWLNGSFPSVVTPGNHEYYRNEGSEASLLTPHWRAQFTLPLNGPPDLEETAYYFDYQGVRIISLDSNRLLRRQAEWLSTVLADNPARWTLVTFHHPIFPSSSNRDYPALRERWLPVLDNYKVDLVLQGHEHCYSRSGQQICQNVAGGTTVQCATSGTVYVTSISGPKMYDLHRMDWMVRAAEDTQLFQIIRIDGNTLSYQAFTAAGDLYDRFDLVKPPDGKPNQLISYPPVMPERLRHPEALIGIW